MKSIFIKTVFTIFSIVLLISFSNCSSDENPLIIPSDSNLISNYSFEFNNSASLTGWNVVDPTRMVEFYNQPPRGGGSWAVSVPADWGLNTTNLSTTVKGFTGTNVYLLSFYGKYNGVRGTARIYLVKPDTSFVIKTVTVEDTTWANYTSSDTINVGVQDSIKIELTGGLSQLLPGKTYFDLCTFERTER